MPGSERRGVIPLGRVVADEAAALAPVVRAVIASVLGERRDHPDVEDCAHEVVRRALEGQGRLREGEPLRPWLLGIARHVAIDVKRRRRRGPQAEGVAGDAGGEAAMAERVPDPAPGPEERALSTERARQISRALAGLSEAQREALLLFHVEGEAYPRIAERLGVPLGTVATWLARGRRALAEALAEVER